VWGLFLSGRKHSFGGFQGVNGNEEEVLTWFSGLMECLDSHYLSGASSDSVRCAFAVSWRLVGVSVWVESRSLGSYASSLVGAEVSDVSGRNRVLSNQ